MSRRVAVLIFLFSFLGTVSAQGNDDLRARAYYVSLIRVIANPRAFDGRRIRLAGYLDHNGLDKAVGVYVSEVDGRNSVSANSVDLHVDESIGSKFIGKYVLFDCTFHAPTGPLADYTNGYVDHVSAMRSWNQGDVSK
ncbi:MAG TPA: hypothetical protein VKR57_00005 [Terriglobales bacterium]|nr:hypothetical protein [Terriglobales bacterium]